MADTVKSTSTPSVHGRVVTNPDGSNIVDNPLPIEGGNATDVNVSLDGENITPEATNQNHVDATSNQRYNIHSDSNKIYQPVYPYVFNGTTWDRVRGNVGGTLVLDPYLEISKGNVPGHGFVHKFGRNPDIDQTREDIWNGGNTYTGFNPTAAETVELFSSSDNDGAGTDVGVRTIKVFGLDSDYLEISETVTLNGVTAVDTLNTYIRLNRMICLTAGSNGSNVGEITARQNVTTANVFAVLPIGYNQTMIAAYTVPAGKSAYVTNWFASLAKRTAGFCEVRLVMRPLNEVFQVKEELTIASTGSSYVLRDYNVPKNGITEKTDIKISSDSSANDMGVSAGFDLILVDNT